MSQLLAYGSPPSKLRSQLRSYTSKEWEAQRSEITKLYVDDDIALKDVVQIMKSNRSFSATERQYKTRIQRWGLDKKIKTSEMIAIVRKERKRKREEGKDTVFFIRRDRKRRVDPRKISRFVKDHDIPDSQSHISRTPSVISYCTIRREKVNTTSSEEQIPQFLNETPETALPSAMREVPFSTQNSGLATTRATAPHDLGEVADTTSTRSNGWLGSIITTSKISFVDQSKSKASTEDVTTMKQFFDFSAAARSHGDSTSSITYHASARGRPSNHQRCKGKKGKEIPLDLETEPESTALEDLNSLIELAGTVEDLGRYEWFRVLLQRVVRLHRQRFGNKHPSTFGTLEALSHLLQRQGRFIEAHQLLVGALKAFLNAGGPQSLDALLCRGLLALAKLDLGLYQQATTLTRNSLELARKILSPNDPVLTRTKENLGIVLSSQGHHEAAEQIHRGVLATRVDTLGEDHPQTLSSMHDLAIALGGQTKFIEMEAIYRSNVIIQSRTLGKYHSDTLKSLHGVATALAGQGSCIEASTLYKEIINERRAELGAESPHTLIGTHNLACVLRDQGKHEEARELCNQLLEIEKRTIGPDHSWTLMTQENLISVLEYLGEDEEAEALGRLTLETRERVLGAEHTSTLASKNQLARLCEDNGKYEEALSLYREVLEARRKVLGERHELTLSMAHCVDRVETAMREEIESVYSD